jgi:hypothetical protein
MIGPGPFGRILSVEEESHQYRPEIDATSPPNSGVLPEEASLILNASHSPKKQLG